MHFMKNSMYSGTIYACCIGKHDYVNIYAYAYVCMSVNGIKPTKPKHNQQAVT